MKVILVLMALLALTACCNGSGPGPRAMLDTEITETTVSDRKLSG